MTQFAHEFCRNSSDLLDQAVFKIQNCFSQLGAEQIWWRPDPNVNSIGNLVLHITGNLRQWGIAPITTEQFDRQREAEFDPDRRHSREELNGMLLDVSGQANELWLGLLPSALAETHLIQGFQVTLLQAIMHTTTHFVGHTHQIILLTRLQMGDKYRFHWTPELERGRLPI